MAKTAVAAAVKSGLTSMHERAQQATLTEETGITVYGAHPHILWERGLNESIHGLLRQSLPRVFDFSRHSQQQLDAIARQRNTRPGNALG